MTGTVFRGFSSHSSTYRKLSGGKRPFAAQHCGPHSHRGHWGIKMRCRVCSQPARTPDITILMKVLGASRAAAYLPNCAHTRLHVVLPLSLSLPCSLTLLSSFLFLSSKWLPSLFPLIPSLSSSHCLSPGRGSEQTHERGRHSLSLTHYSGVAPPAMPTAISLSGLC